MSLRIYGARQGAPARIAAILVLLGGLIQINPIWQYGPYEPWLGTNGAQPDWYLGWLIGALRLMPGFDIHFLNHTWVPNPFWGGVVFPGVVFTTLYAWPWAERKIAGDRRRHDLLDRPRDKPWRTALGAAFFSWVFIIFVAGAADRILVSVGFGYESQVWFLPTRGVRRPLRRLPLHQASMRGVAGDRNAPAAELRGSVVQRSEAAALRRSCRSSRATSTGPAPAQIKPCPTDSQEAAPHGLPAARSHRVGLHGVRSPKSNLGAASAARQPGKHRCRRVSRPRVALG